MITNFHNKKIPKEKAPCKCLSIIMLHSVIKANKKYYPQTLLEKCKYIQEKIKIEKHINDDLGKSESDSDSKQVYTFQSNQIKFENPKSSLPLKGFIVHFLTTLNPRKPKVR